MSYVDGFVIPIQKKDVERYRRIAKQAGKVWRDHGALEYYETVGDDLKFKKGMPGAPFPKISKAKNNETVIFSWIVYKSRSHRDSVNAKVMKDPRIQKMMKDMTDKPLFDMNRMSYGGFNVIVKK